MKIWNSFTDAVGADVRMNVHLGEDIREAAVGPESTLATKLVAVLMPQNIYLRVYENMEANQGKYGDGVVYATAFFTGVSATANEGATWIYPALALAKMTPLIAQDMTESAVRFAGYDEKTQAVAGMVASKVAMGATVALGGIKSLTDQAELFVYKTGGFVAASEGIKSLSSGLVDSFNLGGADKAGAKEDIGDALWILVGEGLGKMGEKKVGRFTAEGKIAHAEVKAADREISVLEKGRAQSFANEQKTLKIFEGEKQKHELAKTEAKVANEMLSLDRIAKNNLPKGEPNHGLANARRSGGDEQDGTIGSFLQEAQSSRGTVRERGERAQRTGLYGPRGY
jgi:hypothetical protein